MTAACRKSRSCGRCRAGDWWTRGAISVCHFLAPPPISEHLSRPTSREPSRSCALYQRFQSTHLRDLFLHVHDFLDVVKEPAVNLGEQIDRIDFEAGTEGVTDVENSLG